MNRLTPELRKLISWARNAPETALPVSPPGFSYRVAARWCSPGIPERFLHWQKAIWASGWAAAALIGFGLVLLSSQRMATDSAYDFSPAYQVIDMKLVP